MIRVACFITIIIVAQRYLVHFRRAVYVPVGLPMDLIQLKKICLLSLECVWYLNLYQLMMSHI